MSFFGELRRRNVVKVAVAYAIVGWLLIEVSTTVLPLFEAPDWIAQVFAFFIILGFPLALVLSWAYELTPEGIRLERDIAAGESITQVTGRKLDVGIIGALVLALGFVVYNYVLEDGSTLETAEGVLPNSVAVLPFENLSLDPENAFFAAGIHEEVLNQLVKLSELNVIARTSMMQYANGDKSIPQVAAELNVETVMEGSVRYAEGRVLVTAQLIDPETNAHLWSDSYNREFADVFAIQADIAMNIANALEAEFSVAEQEAIERRPTESPAAYARYLRGLSKSDFREAILDFDQATALDPEFGLAYAKKAFYQSAVLLGFGANPVQAEELDALARASAEQALELDSNLGLAHAALGLVHLANWRGTASEEAFRRASRLSPNDSDVLTGYARFKRYRGEYAEAIELMQYAVNIDPNNPLALLALGATYRFTRDYSQAAASLRKALELDPTSVAIHINLAIAEVALGDNAEALRLLRLAETLSEESRFDAFRTAQMAFTYSQAGSNEDAQRLFDELQNRALDEPIGEATWARAYMAIGDYEQALQHLELALQDRVRTDVGTLADLAANAGNDPNLEEDTRFQELLGGLWIE